MLKKNCSLEFKSVGDMLEVFIKGEIDHYSAVRIRAEIDAKISETHPSNTILELSKIDFMDSSGIGLIMGRYARMQRIGGGLILRNPSERVERICRLAGLERIVTIEKGGEENEG
jgi:stage II sporulation protein AA (anti-sigma F factor antagonist)